MKAWATLLTQPNYAVGVRALRASLERSGTAYPLVVMVTSTIDQRTRAILEDDGCVLHEVDPLRPPETTGESYANARFAEVWTKLAAWRLTSYDRIVFLDADMLVTQHMDELFSLELPAGAIAACHACRCNPNRIPNYPSTWHPSNCFYTKCDDAEHARGISADGHYLNGGLLVLTPDDAVFADLLGQLATIPDLSRYPFAEQDFLNEYYHRRWHQLPYVYNALKTLRHQHPSLWNASQVKNIHYIIDKPWDARPDANDRYDDLNQLWRNVAGSLQEPRSAHPTA